MSIKIENHCVDCRLPCLGISCPYRNVKVYYCDGENCDNEADYQIDEEHFCESCASELLKDTFDDLTMFEQAKAINVLLKEIGD